MLSVLDFIRGLHTLAILCSRVWLNVIISIALLGHGTPMHCLDPLSSPVVEYHTHGTPMHCLDPLSLALWSSSTHMALPCWFLAFLVFFMLKLSRVGADMMWYSRTVHRYPLTFTSCPALW